VLSREQVSIGLSIINLSNFLGSTIFVTVGQALLQNQLVKKLKPVLPNLNLDDLTQSGASSIIGSVSGDQLPAVLRAYNDSLRSVWYLALGLAALVFLASFRMEWRSVKGHNSTSNDEDSQEMTSYRRPSDVDSNIKENVKMPR
jgi:hypothetical protein